MDTEKIDIWTLIQNGQFEQAVMEADLQYSQTKDIFILRNKVYALLLLKKYEEVILLTNQLMEMRNRETSSDFLFCGIANWFLGKEEIAIELWEAARKAKYKDAGGGVDIELFLYFASIKTGKDKLKANVIKKLKSVINKSKAANWPIPLGEYILGNIESDKLFLYVIPILKDRYLCQIYFVEGLKYLEKNDLSNYLLLMKKITELSTKSYLEEVYFIANGEMLS